MYSRIELWRVCCAQNVARFFLDLMKQDNNASRGTRYSGASEVADLDCEAAKSLSPVKIGLS